MTKPISAQMPLYGSETWWNEAQDAALKACLTPITSARPGDVICLHLEARLAERVELWPTPASVVTISNEDQAIAYRRILEFDKDRARDLAYAALHMLDASILEDHILRAAHPLISEVPIEEVETSDVFVTADFVLVLTGHTDWFHDDFQSSTNEQLRSLYLPACVGAVMPSGMTNHRALRVEPQLARFVSMLRNEIAKATPGAPEPFDLQVGKLSRLAA